MRLIVSDDLRAMFPNLRIGVAMAWGVDNVSGRERAFALLQHHAAQLQSSLTPGDLDTVPEIVAWQEAYARVGAKPRRTRPSAESLIRGVLRSGVHEPISPIVDIYLAAQLQYRLPIGGYDLAKLRGNLVLRRSTGGESFIPMGGGENNPTEDREVVYSDDEHVLTRRWNWRDGDTAKIAPQSHDVVLMSEAPSDSIGTDQLRGVLAFLTAHVTDICGGKVSTTVFTFERTGGHDLPAAV